MLRTVHVFVAVAMLFSAVSASGADDPTYAALRASKPDGRTITLTNFTFERDVIRMTLNGKLALLQPVDGKTPGAVFLGTGSFQLEPASLAERSQLAIHLDDTAFTVLNDTFDGAIFLGGALIAAAEKASAPVAGAADPVALDRWNDYVKRQRKDLHTNVHVRLLQEIVDGGEPFFFASLDGKKLPPLVFVVDGRGAEAVRLIPDLGGEQTMMLVLHDTRGGVWYSSRYKSEIERGTAVIVPPLADAGHYAVDSTINGAEISGVTTMTFTPSSDYRVLPIELTSKLRISDVQFAPAGETPSWTSAAFIQEKSEDDPDAAVVFPQPLKAGQKYLLKTTYGGKEVLDNAGDGNFTVTRRQSWYPNVGTFSDLATYELRFRTPEKFQIIAVGNEIENKVEGKERVALWRTPNPVRVAGFNYGKFKKLSQADKDSGMTIDVYTNPGTPDIIREINMYLQAAADEGLNVGPSHVRVDTSTLAQSALADGINTARTGNLFFGPLDDKSISITQQSQWFFGQSWPTLIYMPYVAFLNGTQRNTLGLNDVKDFVDNVGTHEMGHQWWGHQVGTRTYRDEWISEGFSEFTSALVAQATGGWPRYNAFWENARKNILSKPRGAMIASVEAGPISQGWRISSWRNRDAYGPIVYSKGAYVLHMLRMAMWDRQKGDDAFRAMMTEFATTYAGKNASTGDFKRIVEKHATPNLKLTADGKMDWFFNQWVHGTNIPKLDAKIDFQDIGGGKYKVTGTITQSNVPDNFATVVPVYVQFDKSSQVKLGGPMIVGNKTVPVEFEIPLPKKPQKFVINAMHDILVR